MSLESLTWFTQQLETLCTHDHAGKVNISLYVTRAPVSPEGRLDPNAHEDDERTHTMSSSSSEPNSPSTAPSPDVEKVLAKAQITLPPIAHHRSTLSDDIEKEMAEAERRKAAEAAKGKAAAGTTITTTAADAAAEAGVQLHPRVTAGRPDAATLIRSVVNSAPANQRVLIAACGPAGLMKVTRDTTAAVIQANGPAVELHCEQFSW